MQQTSVEKHCEERRNCLMEVLYPLPEICSYLCVYFCFIYYTNVKNVYCEFVSMRNLQTIVTDEAESLCMNLFQDKGFLKISSISKNHF